MQTSHILTIRELPKTRKMAVDEQTNPLLKLQRQKFTSDAEESLAETAMLYGSAMAMMIRHERTILAQPERLPGLRSSFLSLESHMGRLNRLEFQDVMGREGMAFGLNPHDLIQNSE